MTSKTAITLEDPFTEKVDDDYSQIAWANQEIEAVANSKNALCSQILNGAIQVAPCNWGMGMGNTYDQPKPMITIIEMVETLLRDDHVNLNMVENEIKIFTLKDVMTGLVNAAKTQYKPGTPGPFQTAWPAALVDVPMLTKVILKNENPRSLAIRKANNNICVYELKINGNLFIIINYYYF